MDDWELKLDKMAEQVINENVTSISGVPTWTLVLLEKLLEMRNTDNISDIWPNLELYIHGGVSFDPYRLPFKKIIKNSNMSYLETYNASEGFFGTQNELNDKNLLLMPNYGIFYEFIKVSEINNEHPDTYQLSEVEIGVNYAIIISNNSGLWRYKIGDTIVFSSIDPFKFTISGRVQVFINAFGEEVVIDNAEKAITHTCSVTDSKVKDYTAGPIYLDDRESAGHEWLIEFERAPKDLSSFSQLLDEKLRCINSDYDAKRYKDIALQPLKISVAPMSTFSNWLRSKGKIGGQSKIPRLSNERKYLTELQDFIKSNNNRYPPSERKF